MKLYHLVLVVLFWAISSCASPGNAPVTSTSAPAPTSVVVRITATPRPATSTPTATATATSSPSPTPSSTPLALDKIELEPLLIQSGDLPAGVSAAQVRTNLPEMFDGVSDPDNAIFQQFEMDGEAAGGVTVMLFSKPAALRQTYEEIADGMIVDEPTQGMSFTNRSADVGDDQTEAVVTEIELTFGNTNFVSSEIIFSRCFALVHIRMTGGVGIDAITAYAERLDRRLVGVVC